MDSYIDDPFPQHHESQLRFRSAPTCLDKGYNYDRSPRWLTTAGGWGRDRGDESAKIKPFLDSGSRMIGRRSQLPQQFAKQSAVVSRTLAAMKDSCRVEDGGSLGTTAKVVGGLNLSRQSTSFTGSFAHLDAHSGYDMAKDVGNFRAWNSKNEEESSSLTNRLKRQVDFESGLSSSMSLFPRILEIGDENVSETSHGGAKFAGGGGGDGRFYGGRLSFESWDDSTLLGGNGVEARGDQLSNWVAYSNSDASVAQNGGHGTQTHALSHHSRLPNTSTEMASMEKLMQFQDTVPCKIRAKRGCATHPRSIAERVRRTRISERMKKLQELVPNIEKQTNTADMLDLAVEYVKDLQEQYKMLRDNQARCNCLSGQTSAASHSV
ncbi:hypothetical protein Nepgr_020567 [Nepenthes gracilis]|uniref:BHLH domain-containing protein n=1 Tax=Nepenthes gracilis TaxID=150966 RepID=A0AAD3SZ09_NEPGR|nr:hypothetical protein Nepgr_020567 [Nepenthes gracilis]